MGMTIVAPTEKVSMQENKRLLNRYRYIEHEAVRMLAGWLPATPHMETKLAMGRLLWEDAQHVQFFWTRLREVQTPAFRPPDDAALERLMTEAIHAPTAMDMLGGLFRVIKPALVNAYRWHSAETFQNVDAPTRYYLKHILVDEDAQVDWAKSALADHPAGEWERYIADLLAAAGGVTGLDERRPAPARSSLWTEFKAPRIAARDERFTIQHTPWPTPQTPEEHRMAEFRSYAQEVLAAETVALVLYETMGEMPWAFTFDSARHCYDETRHCILGIEWLAKHGVDYTEVPQNVHVYQWRSQYNPLTQYALLTMGNESHVFPYRHERLKEYQAFGDTLSATYLQYDMSDERGHVSFGHKWLPDLLKWQGESRPLEQYLEDTVALWFKEYKTGTMPIHDRQAA